MATLANNKIRVLANYRLNINTMQSKIVTHFFNGGASRRAR